MRWLEHERPKSIPDWLVVTPDTDTAYAVSRLLWWIEQHSTRILIAGRQDSLAEILYELLKASGNASGLLIDAHLTCAEFTTPAQYGGIELLKHVRISRSLEPLSLLPIAIWTVDTPTYCVRQAIDNVILLSPGCEVMKFPARLDALRQAVRRPHRYSSVEEMERSIKPFTILTEFDEHTFRNLAGVGKFLREFTGLNRDDPSSRKYEEPIENHIGVKKRQFLSPDHITNVSSTRSQNFCKHRYIYIDDEHAKGWSFGLYLGLIGSPANPEQFAASSMELAGGRFRYFSDSNEAERFFTDEADRLQKSLDVWATVIDKNPLEEEIKEAFPYDVLFLDLRLRPADNALQAWEAKEFTGIKLLRKIKILFPEVPVIVFTASRQALSAEEVRKIGADGYWIKGTSTGQELQNAIDSCLVKTELRPIWRIIRMVEQKEEISCLVWNEKNGEFQKRQLLKNVATQIKGQKMALQQFQQQISRPLSDRRNVEIWLKEAFQLLWDGDDVKRLGFHDQDYPYDRIILNMGLIQEIRIKGLDKWTERTLRPVGFKQEELRLHYRRNDMAHPDRIQRATRAEAVEFLKFTLDRLLG